MTLIIAESSNKASRNLFVGMSGSKICYRSEPSALDNLLLASWVFSYAIILWIFEWIKRLENRLQGRHENTSET